MELKHVTNIWKSDALGNGENHEMAEFLDDGENKQWASQFVVGEPKATEKFSSEELKNIGLVGLYKKE